MGSKNQSGFSAVEALLIIVILGILGFTGYFVYHTNKSTDKTLSDTGNSSISSKAQPPKNAVDDQTGFLVIKEWGVKLTKPADGTQIVYGQQTDSPDPADNFVFTTTKVAKLGDLCSLQKDGVGGVTRSKTKLQSEASPPTPLNNEQAIGGYYYYYSHPQSRCVDNDSDQQVNLDAVATVETAIKSIQAE